MKKLPEIYLSKQDTLTLETDGKRETKIVFGNYILPLEPPRKYIILTPEYFDELVLQNSEELKYLRNLNKLQYASMFQRLKWAWNPQKFDFSEIKLYEEDYDEEE